MNLLQLLEHYSHMTKSNLKKQCRVNQTYNTIKIKKQEDVIFRQ